ncbi:hypothetical protein [Thiolapillus sp.]
MPVLFQGMQGIRRRQGLQVTTVQAGSGCQLLYIFGNYSPLR